jgi:hypothetical protein
MLSRSVACFHECCLRIPCLHDLYNDYNTMPFMSIPYDAAKWTGKSAEDNRGVHGADNSIVIIIVVALVGRNLIVCYGV